MAKQLYLSTRLDSLEKEWEKFTEIHDELSLMIKKKDDTYFTVYEKTKEIYFDYMSDIKEVLPVIISRFKLTKHKFF